MSTYSCGHLHLKDTTSTIEESHSEWTGKLIFTLFSMSKFDTLTVFSSWQLLKSLHGKKTTKPNKRCLRIRYSGVASNHTVQLVSTKHLSQGQRLFLKALNILTNRTNTHRRRCCCLSYVCVLPPPTSFSVSCWALCLRLQKVAVRFLSSPL